MKITKILVLTMGLTLSIILAGCTSISPVSRPSNEVQLAGLNYEVIGPVSVKGTTNSILGIFWWGGISYEELLTKAHEMGADDVIKVYEDRGTYSIGLIYNEFETVWTGLAIKYTNTFTDNGEN
ncbi:MAG: hypothetical protein R3Y36_06380 [Spirochaetales bacterium]